MIESLRKTSRVLLGLIFFCFSIFLLAFVNFLLISPWFRGTGPVNLGSIEVSYVSMAKFIIDSWPHLTFAPFWYLGFPFHLFYTPLLPALEVLLGKLGGFPLWQTYRLVSGAGYILVPVSLFFFVWSLTRKIVPALLAGLLYSFLPSLFYFILPSGEVAADAISLQSGFFDPRRLVILARWGEGPHTLSLVFLPLAGLFYFRFLEEKKRRDLVLGALFVALTALTNAIGFYALLFLILVIFFATWVKKSGSLGRTIRASLLFAFLSYGLVAFWYNLSFLSSFFSESGGVLKNYVGLLPWGLVLAVLVITLLFFFFQKIVKDKALIIASFWFLILFLIVYVYYISAPPEFPQLRLEFAPQALRLTTEVDMALSILVSCLLGVLLSFLYRKGKIAYLLGNIFGLALVVGVLLYGFFYLPYGQKAVLDQVDLAKTGEYEVAKWLEGNINAKHGERVFVAGNYGFYLNYFTDVWQLRGGLYQANTHPWSEHIYYQMVKGKDPEIALAWLKVVNIKYIVVNTAASRELYKEFEYPEKFKGLKVVYEASGDITYEVPLQGPSPAKIVHLESLNRLQAPKKGDDKKAILAYADVLESSRPADLTVVNNDEYQIRGQLEKGEGILVQMTYDKGFKATSKQGSLKIQKDPLGFMVLVPQKPGEYQITLKHGLVWSIWLGYLITIITLIIIVTQGFLYIRAKRSV